MHTWSHELASHQPRAMSGRVTSYEWTSYEDSQPSLEATCITREMGLFRPRSPTRTIKYSMRPQGTPTPSPARRPLPSLREAPRPDLCPLRE